MNCDFELEVTCPHCGKDVSIFVEVESPSDYYPDCTCSECGKEIKKFIHWRTGKEMDLDMVIMEEVSDCIADRAEYLRDCAQDR